MTEPKTAKPYVTELDLLQKDDNETQTEYLKKAIINRLSQEVTEAYMKYDAAWTRYAELMRLIEAYREENVNK